MPLRMALDDAGDDVGQVGLRLDADELAGLDQRGDHRPVLASAVRTSKRGILPVRSPRSKSVAVRRLRRGTERAAATVTLIQTAKLNDVDPQAWLADVLARLAEHPIQRLDELLPWNWRAPSTTAIAA